MISLAECEPGRNDLCLCGSGRKFKNCCMDSYSSRAAKVSFELYNKGLYEDALRSGRQHLTWYRLSHLAHTVPLLESESEESKELLRIDIEALAEITGLLHRCYFHTGQSEEFPSVLERLSNAIDDPRWRDKIRYFHALWWLLDKQDRKASLSVISEIDIAASDDSEILSLFVDVSPPEIPFKTKVEILDRIVANVKRPSEVLQYKILKGIAYCLINEIPEGCEIMGEAIAAYEEMDADEKTAYGAFHLARGLQVLGEFKGNITVVRDAITHYMAIKQEAADSHYAGAYFADIEKALGDCYSFLKEYDRASQHYQTSLQHEDSDLTRVFLARVLVNLGDLEQARQTLHLLDVFEFNEYAHYDYAISWTILATRSLAAEDLEIAKMNLKEAKSSWPIFVSQRDSALIDLLETSPCNTRGRFTRLIGALNRYVSLNPNVFGIGINFNRIVEDVNEKEGKRPSDRAMNRDKK
ncbi:SEC-C domain-containing protein [Candidatus Bipolaricaulota bacterium]|nr:SEC-C domain-containing protein [Candidatus Bipolaricaulota bacterium]